MLFFRFFCTLLPGCFRVDGHHSTTVSVLDISHIPGVENQHRYGQFFKDMAYALLIILARHYQPDLLLLNVRTEVAGIQPGKNRMACFIEPA